MHKINPEQLRVTVGRPYPIGPVVYDNGIRFSIFSRHATRVWIALFDHIEEIVPVWEYEFDPHHHRTGDIWSIFVEGLPDSVYFLYRMDGPFQPKKGHRYDREIYLLDPYAKSFVGDIHKGTMKCVAVRDKMDWNGRIRPSIPIQDLVIYETHVKGFTYGNDSGVKHPGTYRGLIEKIPHLKALGVNAVELLPIQEFGESYLGRYDRATQTELTNYWGYSNIGFFAPSLRYAVSAIRDEHLQEFREMVTALHAAGIEIILDVVFNHSSEGNEKGPTLSFRGIDNAVYYLLRDGKYLNYSGCGNTFNCNHPLMRDFILDCLRYWVAVMHIDGFRFDLASILGRDQDGNILENAPLVARIAEDPVLRDTKLIAEAWDAGGAYQVGSFGGVRWAEWNGKYRDDVRRFWRGDAGMKGAFATRLSGSADLYQHNCRGPEHSINFITCHDGFTLHDLVSYEHKHNEANGEDNRDGTNDNFSWNCGVEGESDRPEIVKTRMDYKKSMVATLFLSMGVPMILGGDEMCRTQQGNNNAYCQDNPISWYDWSKLESCPELFAFFRGLIAFRFENPVLRRTRFFVGELQSETPEKRDVSWHDRTGAEPDWNGSDNLLACHIHAHENKGVAIYMMFNATGHEQPFTLLPGLWRLRIHSAAPQGKDYFDETAAPVVQDPTFSVPPQSVVVLTSSKC
ncbi:MAG: glycogen debranching protein GlgX [Candidatus Hydrogenedentes bacterium]|nr:glycogen debranching protein GlgX [Candidatus Hydrogenedentota bacterium]